MKLKVKLFENVEWSTGLITQCHLDSDISEFLEDGFVQDAIKQVIYNWQLKITLTIQNNKSKIGTFFFNQLFFESNTRIIYHKYFTYI